MEYTVVCDATGVPNGGIASAKPRAYTAVPFGTFDAGTLMEPSCQPWFGSIEIEIVPPDCDRICGVKRSAWATTHVSKNVIVSATMVTINLVRTYGIFRFSPNATPCRTLPVSHLVISAIRSSPNTTTLRATVGFCNVDAKTAAAVPSVETQEQATPLRLVASLYIISCNGRHRL